MTDDDECPGCGSSSDDRKRYRAQHHDEAIPLGLMTCPHCGGLKCCMCDAGNDVPCLCCDDGGTTNDDDQEQL